MFIKINSVTKLLLSLLFSGLLLSACDQGADEQVTEEGVRYIKHTNATGTLPDSTSIIDMHYRLLTPDDSVISSTYQATIPSPMPFRFAQAPYMKEPLSKATKGDSLTLYIPANIMFSYQGQPQVPPFLNPDDEVRMEVKVEGVYSMADYQQVMAERKKEQQERMMQLMEESKGKEDKAIQEHVASNSLTAEKTESGLYYVVETQGDTTGIVAGDTAVVHYRGTLLDGTPFDNSYDRGEPFRFPLMQSRVIAGWDEGVPLIGKGGKGVLLIPSHLAYGPSRRSEVIDAFSTLKFEIEVVDILKSEAPVE